MQGWLKWGNMSSSTDKSHGPPAASPGYETRDTNVRGVFYFMIFLAFVLVFTVLLCWGMFRYFSAEQVNPAPASPFAGTRQLPSGPQLQVNPHQDLLRFRAEQEQSLESYAWENRTTGTVRIPIERAMELLVQKGLPVQADTTPAAPEKSAAKGNTKH
jgi:hypothetical protein